MVRGKTLTVPERATITNMGAELGVTTSVFPSDEITLEFLVRKENNVLLLFRQIRMLNTIGNYN